MQKKMLLGGIMMEDITEPAIVNTETFFRSFLNPVYGLFPPQSLFLEKPAVDEYIQSETVQSLFGSESRYWFGVIEQIMVVDFLRECSLEYFFTGLGASPTAAERLTPAKIRHIAVPDNSIIVFSFRNNKRANYHRNASRRNGLFSNVFTNARES